MAAPANVKKALFDDVESQDYLSFDFSDSEKSFEKSTDFEALTCMEDFKTSLNLKVITSMSTNLVSTSTESETIEEISPLLLMPS